MEASLWAEHYEAARSAYPTAEADAIRHETIRRIVNAQVNDLIESARERIKALSLRDLADVRLRGHGVASFSEEMSRRNLELKAFLMRRMYRNERVVHLGEEARRTITALFEAYIENPDLLPEHVARREKIDGRPRMVCDYISGMTDRFIVEQRDRLIAG